MCNLVGIPQYFWIVSGLVLDAVGFVLLGWDLIHLQRDMKKRADENINTIEEFSEKYGGIQNWSLGIQSEIGRIRPPYSARDNYNERLSNIRFTVEGLSNLNQCVWNMAGHLSDFVRLFGKNAERDRQAANRSLKRSIVGVALIVFGFGLQIVGALCM